MVSMWQTVWLKSNRLCWTSLDGMFNHRSPSRLVLEDIWEYLQYTLQCVALILAQPPCKSSFSGSAAIITTPYWKYILTGFQHFLTPVSSVSQFMHLSLPQHVHMEESILLAVVYMNHIANFSNIIYDVVRSLPLCCQLVSYRWEEDQHLIS